MPTASRSSAALIAQWDLDLAEPYQVRLRRTLGDAATDEAIARGAARDAGHARRGAAHPDADLRPGRARGASRRRGRRARPPRSRPHHGRRAARERATRPARRARRARWIPRAGAMPSVMRLIGALGGLEDDELRATFNGGLGMVAVLPREAAGDRARPRSPSTASRRAVVGEVRRGRGRSVAPDTWKVRWSRSRERRADRGRRVGRWVQPARAAGRRRRAASSAARSCWSSRTGPAPRSTGRGSRGSTRRWSRMATTRPWPRRWPPRGPTSSSSPATCGSSGRRSWRAYEGRILNTHPSLLPAFPGAHAVRDALAHGVAVTGATVHLVDATLDGGPIVAQEAVPILPGDDEATLHDADPGGRAPAAAPGRGAAAGRRGRRSRTMAGT